MGSDHEAFGFEPSPMNPGEGLEEEPAQASPTDEHEEADEGNGTESKVSQTPEQVASEPNASALTDAVPEIETADRDLETSEDIQTPTEFASPSSQPAPKFGIVSQELSEDEAHPMDALLDDDSMELEMPRRGEIRTGTIARVTESDILVDIGAKSEAVIPSRELERLTEEQRAELTIGEEITVYVIHTGGRGGSLVVSIARAEEEQDWQIAETLLESQELYEGTVSGFNKGGLIVRLGQLRGFIPASQVSLARRRRADGETPDQRWGKMIDEPIITKVIEVDRRRNRLILSERAAAREARDALKERLIGELKSGEIRDGHVISLADFGAFVDIGGADGLVHLSEISWKRIDHPRDKLKIGQEVKVKVLAVDVDRRRISLSMRELEDDPWETIMEGYTEGQLIEGTITKLTKFGAFASLSGTEGYDIEGLIHISELSDRRIEHPREVVQEGQVLALRVINIDHDRHRIGLSLKRVDSSEYAEQDWKTAMLETESPDESVTSVEGEDVVEDFDAELEAEVAHIAEPEMEDDLESETDEDEGLEALDEPDAQDPVSELESTDSALEAGPEPEPDPEPDLEPEPDPEPDLEPEPDPEPDPEPEPEPELETLPEDAVDDDGPEELPPDDPEEGG